jgi:hypothetical protein
MLLFVLAWHFMLLLAIICPIASYYPALLSINGDLPFPASPRRFVVACCRPKL